MPQWEIAFNIARQVTLIHALSIVSFLYTNNSTNIAGKKGGEMRENKTEAQGSDYVCNGEVIHLSNIILNFISSYLVLCIAKSNYQSNCFSTCRFVCGRKRRTKCQQKIKRPVLGKKKEYTKYFHNITSQVLLVVVSKVFSTTNLSTLNSLIRNLWSLYFSVFMFCQLLFNRQVGNILNIKAHLR